MKSFINKNSRFWSSFPPRDSAEKILIEEPSISMISHLNAIFAIIINQGRGLVPVWLDSHNLNMDLIRSYIPTASHTKAAKLSFFKKCKILTIGLWKFIKMVLTSDILGFSYDGVKYGDIAYDSYLSYKQVATIRKIDHYMLGIILKIIKRHDQVVETLKRDNYRAVMVSHQIGINLGVLLRAALRHGYDGYLRAGHHFATLQRFERPDEVYNYEYSPTPEDVDTILDTLGSDFGVCLDAVFDIQVSGKGTKDAIYAFSSENKYYTDRAEFIKDFALAPKKKNIFVMLHAFNDHPHSHFRWMLFKDYYDWFLNTLAFAKNFKEVNWIFKQHPSIRFYNTLDVSFDNLFKDLPENIVFIDENNQIDTRSLVLCADAVITCLGSAGVELPAMGSIPSVVAGDTFYSNLGFAIEPQTKEEYFKVLSTLPEEGKLTPDQQKRAQAAYMHINFFSRVSISCCPVLSLSQERNKNTSTWYYQAVSDLYDSKEKIIKSEISTYINEISQLGFKRLNGLKDYSKLIDSHI